MVKLQIETNSACNGKCWFCPYQESWSKHNPGKMELDTFGDIIAKFPEIELLNMYMANEPFLDVRLFDMMELAGKISKIKKYNIASNLSIIPKDIEKLKNFNCDLWISFHGADKESYERIMGLDYDNAMKNIKILDSMGFKFQIRGAGYARYGGNVLFTKEKFEEQFKGLNQELVYFSYHDRAGSSKNVDFKATVKIDYCPRWDDWHHYHWDGYECLCCMAFQREPVFSRELCKHCTSPGG